MFIVSVKAQDTRILKVNYFDQEESLWCWAACSQMILDYYGITVEQCNIAEIARVIDERNHHIHYPNSQTMNHFGTTNCCEPYPYNWRCNKVNKLFTTIYSAPGSKGGINSILDSLNISSSPTSSYLTISEIKNEIDGWRPFIIQWGWTGTNEGHFVLARGYNNNSSCIYYFDPEINYPGGGHQIQSHEWMIDGAYESFHHQWTATLVLTPSPPVASPIHIVLSQ
jgi:hypothetical protein